jgi:hypothetical protein
MATPSLALPPDNRRKVFRKLVNILQSDPVLSRVVSKTGWLVWDGDSNSDDPLPSEQVCMRLTPRLGPMSWLDESEQECRLTVDFEFALPGFDADDPLDFQGAIERALYPVGGAQDTANSLLALGASTGLVTFDQPASDPDRVSRRDGGWYARGAFSIDVRRTLNP